MSKATLMGKMDIWGGDKEVWMDLDDLRRHLYVLGKTGSGKSTLLFNMVSQWLRDGKGCGVIDPHGDLIEDLLDMIPKNRIDDVCLINPGDSEYPVSFNPLINVSEERHALVAQGIVRALQGIWADSWGPRMENILRNALQAIMATDTPSFLGLQRMLSDSKYREWVVNKVGDPLVKGFWLNEFGRWDKRAQREAVSPIQNKLGQFLNDPAVRNILCQGKSKVNIDELMDGQKIVLVNLAKGRMGAESANLLGSLLVAFFGDSAMARCERGNTDRHFHLVIDEFHNFMTRSFEPMLSEVRKYGLSMVLSHQYGAQLSDGVRNAVLGNVGTLITFTIGGQDAEIFVREYGHPWSVERFTDVPPYRAIARRIESGKIRSPHYLDTMPPDTKAMGHRRAIIARSRQRYGTARAKVDEKIRRWFLP